MVNSLKIKALMVEKGITQKMLALQMGMSQATVNQKINNTRSMAVDEAVTIQQILGIKDNEFHTYFFS